MAAETSRARRILQPFRVGEFGLQSFISGFLANTVSFMEEGSADPAETTPYHLLQGDGSGSILLGDGGLILLLAAPPPPPPPP